MAAIKLQINDLGPVGPTDANGNVIDTAPWRVPIDSEYKSKVLRIWSWRRPHHLNFQLSWIQFFIAFTATFAAAALQPPIRDALDLTKPQLANAGIAAVAGTMASRILMGTFCDSFGPRHGAALIMLLSAAPVFGMALVQGYAGFLISRMCIGFSLASFVVCSFWCSVMFSPCVVGTANAVAAGWGNMGGGATQLLMPLLYSGFQSIHPDFIAWRISYFVPGALQCIIGMCILLFGQDMPLGNYRDLRRSGALKKAAPHRELWAAASNYRTWVLFLSYGYTFGVELTVDNVVHSYFHDQFKLSIFISGVYASIFGMQNLYARALGGLCSDLVARRWGIQGRLWLLWALQTLGGLACIALGLVGSSLAATLCVLIVFSVLTPMGCGATYGVVPFVSRRALGAACGLVGAGGNLGSVVTQAAFFTNASWTTQQGFVWMGGLACVTAMPLLTMYFPQWGGMVLPAKEGATEEDYYSRDFTRTEREQGLHENVLRFAAESRSQRGRRAFSQLERERTTTTTTAAGGGRSRSGSSDSGSSSSSSSSGSGSSGGGGGGACCARGQASGAEADAMFTNAEATASTARGMRRGGGGLGRYSGCDTPLDKIPEEPA